MKKRLEDQVIANRELKHEMKHQAVREIVQIVETEVPDLKVDGKFVDNVVICVAQLMGEYDIAAHYCASIIECVAKHIFHCSIPPSQLPSKSSCLRFINIGHVIAKLHIREETSTNKFDLHTDGTSRSKLKYVGQQVTLCDKTTLSLGFILVAREDAKCLMQITLDIFEELDGLDIENRGSQLKDILRNLVSMMSDRAAVMKAFHAETEKKIQQVLQSEDTITRLFCNAHFLLGLSSAAILALKSVEKMHNMGRLGRDAQGAFLKWNSTEPAAVRLIRLLCDTLGPRGDEKSGCRDDWIGFCYLQNFKTWFGSFRGNRFNNLFESAAATLHHAAHMRDFFGRHKEASNLKQQSIVFDLDEPRLLIMVAALAVAYIFITGESYFFKDEFFLIFQDKSKKIFFLK